MRDIKISEKVYVAEKPSCPVCRQKLDGATKASLRGDKDPDPMPGIGDYTVCLYCATMLRFGIGRQLDECTKDDLKELLETQPETFALMQTMVTAARQVIRDRQRKNYRGN